MAETAADRCVPLTAVCPSVFANDTANAVSTTDYGTGANKVRCEYCYFELLLDIYDSGRHYVYYNNYCPHVVFIYLRNVWFFLRNIRRSDTEYKIGTNIIIILNV